MLSICQVAGEPKTVILSTAEAYLMSMFWPAKARQEVCSVQNLAAARLDDLWHSVIWLVWYDIHCSQQVTHMPRKCRLLILSWWAGRFMAGTPSESVHPVQAIPAAYFCLGWV